MSETRDPKSLGNQRAHPFQLSGKYIDDPFFLSFVGIDEVLFAPGVGAAARERHGGGLSADVARIRHKEEYLYKYFIERH